MAFNLSGTLVTQSGTDTLLVGPANSGALSAAGGGITTVAYGNRTYVIIPTNLTLSITGTLTHDTERECIVFQRGLTADTQAPNLLIATGANYNFGAPKVAGSTTAFSDSVGWIFSQGTGGIWYSGGFAQANPPNGPFDTSLNGVHVAVQGTLTFNGGRAQGRFNFTYRPGSVVNNTVNAKWIVENQGQTQGQEYLTRIYGGTFNTSELAYEGGSISLGNGLAPTTLDFNRVAAGVGYWEQGNGTFNGTTQVYNTIRNMTFDGNLVDVALRENSGAATASRGIRVQNCGNGSNVNVNGGEVGAQRFNAGYCWITREIETDITSAAGNNIQGRLFIRDTDNGERTPDFPHSFATDTADFTYTAVVDGDISTFTAAGGFAAGTLVTGSGDNEIVLGINNLQRVGNTARPRAAANTGVWVIDSRSNGGVLGTDVYTGHFWSYENQYIAFEEDLAGTGVHTYQAFGVPDEQVTRPRTGTDNIVDYNTTIGNNLAYNSSNVDVNVSMDASDIYDVVKYRKETVTADIESPSASAMHLVRTSGTNNYGNRILNLVSTATLTGNHSNISTLDVNSGTLGEGTYSANTLTQLLNTTDATITVLGAAATALVPAAGATHTRLSLTNTTGVFNNLGAGVFTGGSLNSISLLGVGPITCTDTEFSGTEIGVTGNKTFTDTSGTPVILNSTGLVLTGNEWTSGSSISLTTGVLNLDGGSYTTALTGTITAAQTWTWSNLTASSIDFDISTISGGGIITINTNNAGSLAEAQRWVATLTTAQQSRFTVPVPAIQRTINVTIPTSAEGFITLRNLTDDTNETRLIASGVISAALPDISSEDTDSYRLYYKLESTVGGATYRTRIQDVPTGTADINIEPLVVNPFFTDGAQAGGLLGFTFAASTTADIIGTFSATSAAVETTRAISQGAAVAAANDDDYFNWIVANELTVDPIDYQPGSVLFNTSVDGVTTTDNRVVLRSNVNTAQTIINNWNGVITNDTGGTTISTGAGIRQVLNIPIGEADIATVTTAVSGTISAGLVSFWTSHTVGRGIRRAIGYLVSNLVSRIPRRQGFDNTGSSDTNYLNNL